MHIPAERLKHAVVGVVSGLALLISGCAATNTSADSPEPPAAAKAGDTASAENKVESINVVGSGDRVLIGTTGPVRYTVFRLSEPDRLIVDMPGVSINEDKVPFNVDNDFITTVEAATYGGTEKIGRVTIGLAEGVDHEVNSGDSSILVSLAREVASNGPQVVKASTGAVGTEGAASEEFLTLALKASAPEEEDLSAEDAPDGGQTGTEMELNESALDEELEALDEELNDELDEDAAEELDEPEVDAAESDENTNQAVAMSDAEGVVSVDRLTVGDQTVIKIKTDGVIGKYDAFDLGEPSRIVVDVWGVGNSTGVDSVNIGPGPVDKARIGVHPDKTRVVFDSPMAEVPSYRVTKAGDTIILTVAGAPAEAAEEPEAPQMAEGDAMKEAAEADEAGMAEVAEADEADMAETELEPPAGVAPMVEPGAAVKTMKTAEAEQAPADGMKAMDTGPESAPEPAEGSVPMSASEPEAPEPSAVVEEITFEKLPDKARLAIHTDTEADYTIKESDDGRTLLVDVTDARIPEALERTLDATKLQTPVRTISSYQESLAPHAVRVLVRMKKGSEYLVTDQDGRIVVDFPLMLAREEEPAEMAEAEEKPAATPEEMAAAEEQYTGAKIDLDMTDANIRDILRLMAEVSDMNIIASDEVAGTITLRLKDVPWDQAFDIILKSKGLDRIREGNVIRVAPAAQIRAEKQQAVAAQQAEQKLEKLELHFIPINYAEAKELAPKVKNVLSGRGTVTSEERTNTLIIRDIKSGVEEARNLIEKLDTPIPQVLIEARIVEAESNFARDLGIQWGVDYQAGGSGKYTTDIFGSTTTSGQTPPSNTNPPAFGTRHGAQDFAVNLPITAGQAGSLGALGLIFGKAGQNPLLLDLRLSAGEQKGRLKTISRPRITTMDNKEATIEQGSSVPFQTTSAAGTQTSFVDASLSLKVTPHITPDGSVLMKIEATRNSIGTVPTGATAPSINTKEATTEVLVRDGETTVIGGIVISEKSESQGGIPLLKDIPVIGWIFKNKSVSDDQTELLIFITPTIIREEQKIVG